MATPRSRSPRREAVGGFFSAASAAWSAATNALKSKVQGKKSETDEPGEVLTATEESLPKNEGPQPEAKAAEATAVSEAESDAKGEKEPQEPEEPEEPAESAVQCFGCGQRFKASELQAHLESSEKCLSAAWQAAVNAIGCMPGAGTTLWCPACPDAFLGKWTGSISKASALLRHVASASKTGVPESAPKAHAWFLTAFVALLLSSPPPTEDTEVESEERLQEWISSSPPLVNIVGPLLAKPGPAAREAVRAELEDSESAPWPFGASDAAVEVKKTKKSKKPKVTSEAPGYDLYNEDIPMDVFMACEDHTRRTSDGVPVLDLLSSDEDELTQL